MMLYELDDTEKEALMGAEAQPRAGERVQQFWCDDCKEWHRASVLGGPIGEPHK
jgi:hypothetical protein